MMTSGFPRDGTRSGAPPFSCACTACGCRRGCVTVFPSVVGRPDDLKGEGIVAFVTLEAGRDGDDALVKELRAHVGTEIGPIARPDEIRCSDALPKTRSGKIMRRILRALAAGQEVSGDTSTLEDRSVLDRLRA